MNVPAAEMGIGCDVRTYRSESSSRTLTGEVRVEPDTRSVKEEPSMSIRPSSTRVEHPGTVGLVAGVAVLVATTSAIGVFAGRSTAIVEVTGVRGDVYPMVSEGIYRYNSERAMAEGFGWDLFTLAVAVPALMAVAFALTRWTVRARLVALGLLAYAFYQYLMYALAWAFGPLFLLFVATYALSLVALVRIGASFDSATARSLVSEAFPRRGMIALCSLLTAALTGMWMQRIVAGWRDDFDTAMLDGQTTMVVQALDLGVVVPLAAFTAWALWRVRPIGYLLSAVFVVKGVAMAWAICAMLLSAWATEGELEIGSLILFAGFGAAATLLAFKVFATLAPGTAPPGPSAASDELPPVGMTRST
jgi:hypothetical protein